MIIEPGTTIDSYTLEEKIGEGGFGEVWKVISNTKKTKAIKIPKKGLIRELIKEAEINQKLTHKNIIKIEQIHTTNPAYLLMEYFEGQNLRQKKQLTQKQAIEIIIKTAEALEYAHKQGVVHSDLKPENILVGENLDIKVCDFGLAKILADDAESEIKLSNYSSIKNFQGTIRYASPEQLEGQQPTPQSDIFSLTKILYELITGENLRFYEQPHNVLSQKRISKQLSDIIIKGLQPDPAKRHKTMELFAERLKSYLKSPQETETMPEVQPEEEMDAFKEGIRLLKEEKFTQASELFTKALKKEKNNAEIYFKRGIASTKIGLFKEAISDFKKAINLEPTFEQAYFELGLARVYENEREESPKKMRTACKEAVKDFASAIKLNPRNIEARLNRARLNLRIGIFESQLIDYSTTASEALFFDKANQNSMFVKDNIEYALEDLEKIIEADPKRAEAYFYRAIAKKALKKSADANSEDVEKAIQLQPDQPFFYVLRATPKLLKEDFRGATYDYDKFLELKPNFMTERKNLRDYDINIKQATTMLRSILEKRYEEYLREPFFCIILKETYYSAALEFFERNNLKRAEETINVVIELTKDSLEFVSKPVDNDFKLPDFKLHRDVVIKTYKLRGDIRKSFDTIPYLKKAMEDYSTVMRLKSSNWPPSEIDENELETYLRFLFAGSSFSRERDFAIAVAYLSNQEARKRIEYLTEQERLKEEKRKQKEQEELRKKEEEEKMKALREELEKAGGFKIIESDFTIKNDDLTEIKTKKTKHNILTKEYDALMIICEDYLDNKTTPEAMLQRKRIKINRHNQVYFLDLSNIPLLRKIPHVIKDFLDLRYLYIENTKIKEIIDLQTLVLLEEISLEGNQIREIGNIEQKLNIGRYNSQTDYLLKNVRLWYINLKNNPLSKSSQNHLEELKKRGFELRENGFEIEY